MASTEKPRRRWSVRVQLEEVEAGSYGAVSAIASFETKIPTYPLSTWAAADLIRSQMDAAVSTALATHGPDPMEPNAKEAYPALMEDPAPSKQRRRRRGSGVI